MGFDASKPPVKDLSYNFTKYVSGCQGVTDEPTEDQVINYQFAIRDAAKELGQDDLDTNDPAAVAKFMENLTREDMMKANEAIFTALAILTGGKPSKEEMQELSSKAYRLAQAYMGYVTDAIFNPKVD